MNRSLLALLLLAASSPIAPGAEDEVMAFSVPQASPGAAALQERLYRIAERQARYLRAQAKPWTNEPSMKLLTESRSGEHHIRPNSGALEGFCMLHRFGPYDAAAVGCSREALRRETILPMLRYLAATHVTGGRRTGDGKCWGDAWQSAHWAQMMGRGAWWVWPELPADLRAAIRRVIAHEADRIARATPPHQLRNDTKAEENAWNSQVLSVAVLLMPRDARRPEWERQFQRWAMSAFLRPADERSEALVDGRPVREQFTGANIFDDFTLENHGFVHPDYMTTFSLSLGCAADFRMTGRTEPEALRHNVPGLYENIKWLLMPDGGFVYPNGQDWEVFRQPAWLAKHVQMAVFGKDPEALALARLTTDTIERMQARNASGAIYFEGEYFFPSTQTDILSALARSWLALGLGTPADGAFAPRLGVRRLDGAKIILHRTPRAVHTVSWGAQVMAQCMPMGLDRLVSPDTRNGIGHLRLAGGATPLPVKLADAEIESGTNSFRARLVVTHGASQAVARLEFVSEPDGRFRMREELTAAAPLELAEVATGLIGILNDPHWIHEAGSRTVSFDGEVRRPEALSKIRFVRPDTGLIAVDKLVIEGPSLAAAYLGADRIERGRATDRLYLNYRAYPDAAPRAVAAGAVISRYEATLRCDPSR